MKNILLLINQLHTGGAQKVVSRLSIELSRQYNVYLITYNSTESMFEYSGEHIFIKLPFSSNPYENNAIARSIRLMVLIYQVKKIKRKKRIQAAISFLEASNIINVLSKGNEKVILSVRSHLSSELRDDKRLDIFKHMVRLLYNRAFKIVVPSELMKSDLSENFSVEKSKIAVIYNFIDQEQIKELTKEILDESLEKILSNSPFLINVGRMTNPKAQSFLIPILKKVKQTVPSIKLMLLGDGSLKNEFIHSAKQHQLHLYDSNDSRPISEEHDILLLGFRENPYPYLHKSALMVSTSIYEGFPNAMIEAMACGLPVVSSDCSSGPREILAPGTDIKKSTSHVEYAKYGILLPVLKASNGKTERDIDSWAQTIVELLQDNRKRTSYGEKSVLRSNDFNKKEIISKWTSLIES